MASIRSTPRSCPAPPRPGSTLEGRSQNTAGYYQMTPPHPEKGDTVQVRARFLVDANEGDKIVWEDGQTTVLGKPISGRVFTFDLLISLRSLHSAS